MKKGRTIIGLILALALIVLLLNPQWLPLSGKTLDSFRELQQGHFLIEGSPQVTAAHLLTVLLAVCVVWAVYTLLSLLLGALGKRNDRTATVTNLLRGTLKYLSVIAAVIWCLSILGVNTATVLAGVGIIGLILGFGAQSLIEDIITGFFIIFEGQYGIGDIIILDDFRGIVRNIGVRTTVIEDTGGNLKIVNNSDIRNLQNRSRISSLAVVDVGVDYSTDLMALEDMLGPAMQKMFEDNRALYLSAPRYMGVESLADSAVVLRFCVETKEVNIFAARRRLARDLRVLFAREGVAIPFPQVVVHEGD